MKASNRTASGCPRPAHSSRSGRGMEGTLSHPSRSLQLGRPRSAPLPCLPPNPATGLQGGMEWGPARLLHWGGCGGNNTIVLPALHETLKGSLPDPHTDSAWGREVGLFSPALLWGPPLPHPSIMESNLRIKSSPGASWAWSQPCQGSVPTSGTKRKIINLLQAPFVPLSESFLPQGFITTQGPAFPAKLICSYSPFLGFKQTTQVQIKVLRSPFCSQ